MHAGALNYVKVTGLQPSTRYYYIYGDLVRCCQHYSLLDTLPFALCSDFIHSFIHSLHALQSENQVRCSKHSMAALQPDLFWDFLHHVNERPITCKSFWHNAPSKLGVLPAPACRSLIAGPSIREGAYTVSYSDKVLSWPLQKRGMGSELTFMTSPAPGPSGTLKLLAIADHGHAEVIAANSPRDSTSRDI